MQEYVEEAIGKGLDEVGFAGHVPLLHFPDEDRKKELSIPETEFPIYAREVEELKKKYSGKIKIKLGCEIDYIPEVKTKLSKLLSEYKFDYVYGSTHFLPAFPDSRGFCIGKYFLVDHPDSRIEFERVGVEEIYQRYFNFLTEAIGSGLFDIVAHPDLVKKFAYRPRIDITPQLRKIVCLIKENDLAIEINTSGLRKPVKEIYPSPQFLHLCAQEDIPITLGSDAHHPSEVGQDLAKAIELARQAGYQRICIFNQRKRKEVPLM